MKSSLELAQKVIELEIDALVCMSERLENSFEVAVDTIMSCKGRVVVLGMGKSGIIGKKIVATLASTGTPAFFVHPGEAFHGDLGMIKSSDTALMISNSGNRRVSSPVAFYAISRKPNYCDDRES